MKGKNTKAEYELVALSHQGSLTLFLGYVGTFVRYFVLSLMIVVGNGSHKEKQEMKRYYLVSQSRGITKSSKWLSNNGWWEIFCKRHKLGCYQKHLNNNTQTVTLRFAVTFVCSRK